MNTMTSAENTKTASQIAVKVANMTDAQKEARVQEIYSIQQAKLTEAEGSEFFAIMFGGVSPSE